MVIVANCAYGLHFYILQLLTVPCRIYKHIHYQSLCRNKVVRNVWKIKNWSKMSSRVDLPSTKNKDWYVFLEIRLVNCSSLSAVNYREVEMCSFIHYFAWACSGGFTHLYSGWFIFGKYMLDGNIYVKYSISYEYFKILCIICKTPYTMPLDKTHYTKIQYTK